KKRTIERELAWVRSSPSARRSKSKARLAAFDELVNAAERAKQTFAQIQIPPGPRLGNLVIEAENLEKAYGEKCLFKDLTFKLPPGGIVGVIGPNGAGKSTMFKIITGQEQPDDGAVRLGDTVQLAFVDQSRDSLNPNYNVLLEILVCVDIMQVGRRQIQRRALSGSI